jgi:hypothetical protein
MNEQINTVSALTEEQWYDEIHKITREFVQGDDDLGMLLLDGSPCHWDRSYEEGLTPQQALDELVGSLL